MVSFVRCVSGHAILAACLGVLSACSPPAGFPALTPQSPQPPHFDVGASRFVSFDGAALGLTVWAPKTPPDTVIVAVHGINDHAVGTFHLAASYWAERGVQTYAYDHRGFGRSVGRGYWPQEDLLRADLRTAVALARARHPDARLAVVGVSMGAAVVMTAFAGDNPPQGVDRVIFSGPGLRGWGTLPFVQKIALWVSARVHPGWRVRPPRFVKIVQSDNSSFLRERLRDPLLLNTNRIEQVHGVVTLMENAHQVAPLLAPDIPMLLTYGANDQVVPKKGVCRTVKHLPANVRTAYYPDGYHMLLRDLQARRVFADIYAFLNAPSEELPSGTGQIPDCD